MWKVERVQLADVAVLNPGAAAELLSHPERLVSLLMARSLMPAISFMYFFMCFVIPNSS